MIWVSNIPQIIQLEPTNACNFSCSMCLNSSLQQETKLFFPLDLFQRLSQEIFPSIKRLVLYGMGEPLMHPSFLEMLKIAKANLSTNASLFFLTNGSLLTPKIIDRILEESLADEVAFSCETLTSKDSSKVGHSLKVNEVFSNLRYLLNHDHRSNIKIGIETVLMNSNYKYLPEMVKKLGELGADYFSVSHLYPYDSSLSEEVLYTMISKEALIILDELGESGWDFILGVTKEQFGKKMQLTFRERYKHKENIKTKDRPYSEKYDKLLKKAKEMNVTLNIPLYMNEREKIERLQELQNIFSRSKDNAKDLGIELILPSIFSEFKNRRCPYQSIDATVIRADGEVAPCFKYLYDHNSSLNQHERATSSHSFGNIDSQPFASIWNGEKYRRFREKLNEMNKNIPFCGNCSLSSSNCFYAIEDTSDCWGNEPSCSECPYSMNLTRCLL